MYVIAVPTCRSIFYTVIVSCIFICILLLLHFLFFLLSNNLRFRREYVTNGSSNKVCVSDLSVLNYLSTKSTVTIMNPSFVSDCKM